MATQAGITRAYLKAYDKERAVLFPPGTLAFIKERPGVADEELLVVTRGFLPSTQRNSEVETSRRFSVLELAETGMTEAVASGANRIVDNASGTRYSVDRYDPPYEAPRQWVFSCSELKVGAIR
jgi:hypothetical protein